MRLPDDLARGERLVEQVRRVVPHASRQDERLPGARRDPRPGQLLDRFEQPVEATQAPRHRLPPRQEARQLPRRHRLQLGAQARERAALEPSQDLGVADVVAVVPARAPALAEVLAALHACVLVRIAAGDRAEGRVVEWRGVERRGVDRRGVDRRSLDRPGVAQFERSQRPLDELAGGDERPEHEAHDVAGQAEAPHDLHRREGPAGRRIPRHQAPDRVVSWLEERLGHPDGQRHAERVAQQPRVLDAGPHRRAGDPDLQDTPGVGQIGEPPVDLVADLRPGARRDLRCRQRPEPAQHVGDVLAVAAGPLGRQLLQLRLDVEHRLRVEQVAHQRPVGAEQVGQQPWIQGQRGGATLGQRGVALIQELRDITEHEAAREGRRRRGLHVGDLHAAGLDGREQVPQRGHVEDVLHALADGLEHDGELRVARRDLQQVRGPLPLLPQRAASPRVAGGHEQRPRRALAEARREERRTAQLAGHQLHDVLRGRQHRLGEPSRPGPVVVLDVDVGQADDDAVVAVHDLHVELELLAQPRADAQRPRRMHLSPVGGVQDDAPVAQLVAESLEDEVPVVGHPLRGLGLLVQIGEQVVDRPVVQARAGQALACGLRSRPVQLAHERADGRAELAAAADAVALPEGKPTRCARRRRDEHPVIGDLLDAPGGGAEREDVADARFVDHLLVQLAHAPRAALRAGEEHPEEPPVGDRAAAGHREPQRPRPPGQHVGRAVPHDPRPQLGELFAGVAPGEHVEHRVQHGSGQLPVGRGPAHERQQVGAGPVVLGAHGDDLLGEHVQGVGGDAQLLDRAGTHALDDHRRLHEVAAELGEEDPAGGGSDLMAGAAHPLQGAGDRRRRLDLHDEVDGAHVDAQLQAARRDDRREPAALEVVLDGRPCLLAHRPVMRPRDGPRGSRGHPGGEDLRRWRRR